MQIKTYNITLISLSARIVRNVIAPNSIAALRIGISMMPELSEPCGITCKIQRVGEAA